MYYKMDDYSKGSTQNEFGLVLTATKTNNTAYEVKPSATGSGYDFVPGGLDLQLANGLLYKVVGQPTPNDHVGMTNAGPVFVVSTTQLETVKLADRLLSTQTAELILLQEQLVRAVNLFGYERFLKAHGVPQLPESPNEALELYQTMARTLGTEQGLSLYAPVACLTRSDSQVAHDSYQKWAQAYHDAGQLHLASTIEQAKQAVNQKSEISSAPTRDLLAEHMNQDQLRRADLMEQSRRVVQREAVFPPSVTPRDLQRAHDKIDALLPIVVADRFRVAKQLLQDRNPQIQNDHLSL